MAPTREPTAVVLTGFGPFGDHKTNDSWRAVTQVAQGARGKQLEDSLGIKFITQEMPVCYEFADQTVPQLWENHQPLFVLHVGIHPEDSFKIETQSKKTDYDKKDVNGQTPNAFVCKAGTCEVVETTLDTVKLLADVKAALSKTDVQVILSNNPGNYLCGYTYYMSLCHDAGRTLFLHIPPPSSSVPVSHKVDVVEAVVTQAVIQIRQRTLLENPSVS